MTCGPTAQGAVWLMLRLRAQEAALALQVEESMDDRIWHMRPPLNQTVQAAMHERVLQSTFRDAMFPRILTRAPAGPR